MHSLMQVTVKSPVFGRFCFAHPYRGRSETYRQRNINSKHTVRLQIDAPHSGKQWKDRSTGTIRANKLLMAPDRHKKKHTLSFASFYCR